MRLLNSTIYFSSCSVSYVSLNPLIYILVGLNSQENEGKSQHYNRILASLVCIHPIMLVHSFRVSFALYTTLNAVSFESNYQVLVPTKVGNHFNSRSIPPIDAIGAGSRESD